MLIELRQALISYQDYHMLLLTHAGRSAYVAQEAWIQNLSVRENILFGSPYERERYEAVLDACALRADLALMARVAYPKLASLGLC